MPEIYPARGDTIWSVDMIVGSDTVDIGSDVFSTAGYGKGLLGLIGRISGSTKFSYGGTDYTVVDITVTSRNEQSALVLQLPNTFPTAPADLLILDLDGTQFRLGEANQVSQPETGTIGFNWSNPGLTWSDGEPVAVKLIAVSPPKVTSISVVDAPSDDTYAIADTIDLAVTFSEDLTLDVSGGTPGLELTVGDSTRTATCLIAAGTQLTCRYPVDEGIAGAIGVAANKLTLNGATLVGPSELSADTTYTADEVGIDADLRVDAVRPTLVTSGTGAPKTTASGSAIDLRFSETLSTTTAPASAFTVTVDGQPRTVEVVAANLIDRTVALTLSPAVTTGETVTVAYMDPTANDDANAVQDAAGNDAATFDAQAVRNVVGPEVVSLALSDAGTDGAYGIGDTVSVTVTFTDSVDVAGVPRLDIDVAGSDKPLDYSSGTGTTALLFKGYVVAESEEDTDGIEIAANELELNGGTIRKKGSTTINAIITHAAVAADATHRVDGVRPTFVSAVTSTNGAIIDLTFSERLSATTAPASAFTVRVNGSTRGVSSVSASGTDVTLTLASAVATGDTVTVAYMDPTASDDANAVQDAGGNDAATFAAQTVTNRVDLVAPTLVTTGDGAPKTSNDGKKVLLTFSEVLSSATAPTSAFTVTVDGTTRGVTSVFAGGVVAAGPSVTLVLASAVATGETVTVAYMDPTGSNDENAVQDAAGNDAATFSAETVTNNAGPGTEGDVLWSVEMTVGTSMRTSGPLVGHTVGYESTTDGVVGSLSRSDTFEYGGTPYSLFVLAHSIALVNDVVIDNELIYFLSSRISAAPDDLLVLALDGTEFRLDEATGTESHDWDNPGLAWSDGEPVAVKLIAVPGPEVASVAVIDAPSDTTYAIADTIDLAVTFTKDLTLDVTGGTPRLELTVGDSTRTATCGAATGTQLTCRYPVAEGIAGAIGVAANKLTLNGATLEGPNGLAADTTYTADEVGIDAALRVDGIRPTLVTSGTNAPRTTPGGRGLYLDFSEDLSPTAAPASAFTVTVDGTPRTLRGTVDQSDTQVILFLASTVAPGETVTVAYMDPTAGDDANAIQDLAGNDAATFDAQTVRNDVEPAVASLALSDAGTDGAYAIGDTVSVTVTFTDSVDVTGTPRLDIDVAGSDKQLDYSSGTGTTALLFKGYVVAENDSDDDGIEIAANELELNGGTIRRKGSTTSDAFIAHAAVAADATHRVDGVRPTLVTSGTNAPRTTPDGIGIHLHFNEELSQTTTAPASAFTVTVAGTARTVTSVHPAALEVLLVPASAVAGDQTVTVGYMDPTTGDDANAVQDLAGNDAATFTAQTVMNRVPSTDASLSALTLSGVTLEPTFHTDSLNYTSTVAHSVSLTTVEATTSHTSATVAYVDASDEALTDASTADGFQVAVEVGANTIGVRVTAQDGVTQKTYVVVVTRQPSDDARLSGLNLSGVTLTPLFHPDSTSYTGSAPHSVAMTTLSAVKSHVSATVAYLDGSDQALVDADAADGFQVALEVGANTIKVRVTAQDGVTRKTYTVVVTRHVMAATGVTLSVSPAEVGEGDGQTALSVTGTLNGGAFTEDRTVALSVSPVTASASEDFTAGTAMLTIVTGQTSGMATLTLTPVSDDVDEDDETVMVAGTASGGLTVTGATVTITDDDTRGVGVSETSVEFDEGGSGTYTVVLESQPTATVTVGVSVAGDADVTVSPPSLAFTTSDWDEPRTVTVRAAQDVDAAGDTATVSHTVSGGDYGANGVTAASVQIRVTDDDTPSTGVTLTVMPGRVGEGEGQTPLSVTGKLNGAALAADRAVSLSVSAGTAASSDFTAGTATLTIEAGATSGTATLTLTPVDDDVDEDDETVTVTGTVSRPRP